MRRMTLILIALALVVAACTGDTTDASPTTTTTTTTAPDGTNPTLVRPPSQITGVLASQTLVQFDQCDSFLDYVIEHALALVGPYGLQGGGFGFPRPFFGDLLLEDAVAAPVAAASVDGAESSVASAPRAGVDFSGTNVQELGVDEPDIVKTDGNRIVVLAQQTVFVIDVSGDDPKLLGKISLPDVSIRDLFLFEDRVLALGGGFSNVYYGGVVAPDGYYPTPISKIVEIDISGGEPEVVRTLEFDGTYISARLVGDSARVVLTSNPHRIRVGVPRGRRSEGRA